MYLKLQISWLMEIDAAGTYVFIDDNGTWKAYPATGSAGNYTVASDAAAIVTITGGRCLYC